MFRRLVNSIKALNLLDRRRKRKQEAARQEEEQKKKSEEQIPSAVEISGKNDHVNSDDDDLDPDGLGGGPAETYDESPDGAINRREKLYHFDEMASYTNRSIRSHHSKEELQELSREELKNRKVRIHEEVTLVDHMGDAMTEEEMQNYYMQEEDFRRCDADVELTTYRWEKAKKGRGKFDETENSLRGLEDVIAPDVRRENLRIRHTNDILTEAIKQRASGNEILDWEKIRAVAEKTSKVSAKHAEDVGQKDEMDAKGVVRSSSQRFKSFKNNRAPDRDNRKSMGKMRLMLSFKKK